MADPRLVEEASRDIVAARAELTGRRDQVTAEYDDRLAALGSLAGAVESGAMSPRSAQAQVRRILTGDRARAGQPRHAGRTRIGMSVPSGKQQGHTPAGPPQRDGPTPARAQMAVSKMLSGIDRRVMHLLAVSKGKEAWAEARCELSLLLQIRGSLETHLEEIPRDVILLTSVVEYTDFAQEALDDLEAGGPERLNRLLDHDRALASELLALGGSVSGIKDQVVRAKTALAEEGANRQMALKQALEAFSELQDELQRRFPVRDPSMLDKLLGSTG